MRPYLGFWATKLSLAVKRFAGGNEVKSSSLRKLWAKNILLGDLGFVVLLLAVKLHWHPEHFVPIWKGWLTGNSTGRQRKIHSLRHVLKQSRSWGRLPFKEELREKERECGTPGLLPISYRITLRAKNHMGLKTAVLLKEVRSERQKETEMEKNVELCQSDMTVKIQSVIFSVLSIYL